MIQDILYYWKSILSAVLALVLGVAIGVGGVLFTRSSDGPVILGPGVASLNNSYVRALEASDPVVPFPLTVTAYYPLVRPVDLAPEKAWVMVYSQLDYDVMKNFYDAALNQSPWVTVSSESSDEGTVYQVKTDSFQGELILSKVDAPGIKSTIQGSLNPI